MFSGSFNKSSCIQAFSLKLLKTIHVPSNFLLIDTYIKLVILVFVSVDNYFPQMTNISHFPQIKKQLNAEMQLGKVDRLDQQCTTRSWSVMSSNPTKTSLCFLEQETVASLLSTGWFQKQIQV